MKKLLSLTAGVVAAVVLALGAPAAAQAAPKPSGAVPTGNDVSWPQCGKTLPKGQVFAVVGLNDGTANTTNPCFSSEWGWAQTSVGGTQQPKAAIYVNTANPGHQSLSWPTSDSQAIGLTDNPYGTCAGAEDAACAYVYGWMKAYDDVNGRGAPAGAQRWWLDVETGNTWSADTRANRADLEAMTVVLQRAGGTVGVYSTRYQYGTIAGAIASDSALFPLASWLAGGSTQKGAQNLCSAQPLTGGSRVSMAQYVSSGFDYDVSCPA